MHYDHSTILVVDGCRITLIFYVSCQKTNLSTHFDKLVTKVLDVCVMLKLKRFCEGDHRVGVLVCDTRDRPLLSVATREVSRCNNDLFTDFPVKGVSYDIVQGN